MSQHTRPGYQSRGPVRTQGRGIHLSLAGQRTHGQTRKTCTDAGAGAGQKAPSAAGGGDLHVDASAVVGEPGQLARLSRGANEQLVRGPDRIIPNRAIVRGRVARRGHDQDLCGSQTCGACLGETSHSSRPASDLAPLLWLRMTALRRRALIRGAALTRGVVDRASSDLLCARLRSAARHLP